MKVSSELLYKYAHNKCSELENEVVEQWLNSIEDSVSSDDFKGKGRYLWGKINKQIRNRASLFKRRAVAVFILFLLGFTSFQLLFNSNKIIYKTLAGEVKSVTLNDGTIVFLNSNSTLEVSNKFSETLRIVSLSGEGYFEVVKDSIHPFIVKTSEFQTKVLGTKFNLSAYPNEKVMLTLNEGKVLFENKRKFQKLILLPNQQSFIKNDSLIKIKVNSSDYNNWINHKMYINNEPFIEVIRKLQRKYNVYFIVNKPKIKNYICKGVYNNTSLKDVLQDLSFVLKFKYKIKGKTITID